MLRKICEELVAIRKELQAIRSNLESFPRITFDRAPYETRYRVSMKPQCKDQ